jgi:hypothetical protein
MPENLKNYARVTKKLSHGEIYAKIPPMKWVLFLITFLTLVDLLVAFRLNLEPSQIANFNV